MVAGKQRTLDIAAVRRSIADLLATDIFSSAEANGPLFRAAYMWLIVNLHELLQAVAAMGVTVAVPTTDEDVVALIQRARYALVHGAAGYLLREGQPPNTIQVGDACGYPDDIAVEIGGVRVLLRRHAADAFAAACALLDRHDEAAMHRDRSAR